MSCHTDFSQCGSPVIHPICFFLLFYLITRTVKAVVCGGMLAVMKDACSTLTRNPAVSEEREVRLPNKSKISVLGEILNRTTEEGF